MKRFIMFLAMVAMMPLAAMSQTSDQILWKNDSLKHRFDFIGVHPNGNILGGSNTDVYEINGSTGKFVRYFGKLDYDNILNLTISKDGKYFLIAGGATKVIDYQKGYSVFGFGGNLISNGAMCPDSKRIIVCTAKDNSDSSDLFIYNLETKQYEKKTSCYEISWPWSMAVSDDGNYLAIAGIFATDYGTHDEAHYGRLIIFDAHTLAPIKSIGDSFVTRTFVLRFSPDSKYLGVVKGGMLKIWSVVNFNLVKQYNPVNRPFDGISDYCFINNNTLAITSRAYSDSAWFEIDDFTSDQVLYRTNGFGSYESKCDYNPINNSLVLTNTKFWTIALDLNKIDSMSENPTGININYQNGVIFIDNIFGSSPNININIINLLGQYIHQYSIEPPQNNCTIQIPIALPNGSYIVQIIDGSKEYSKQIIVNN